MFKIITLFLPALLFSLCSSVYAYQFVDNIGFLGINSAVTDATKITHNKYVLESGTSSGAPVDQLVQVIKKRAAQVCSPKHAALRYKIGTETYNGEVNAFLRAPMQAPNIIGVATCN